MPDLIEQAKATIEARNAEASKVASAINIKELVKTDPTLVAKAEEKAAKAKAGQLSATQAGKVKTRAKAQPTA